ncbi:Sedlin, N-terminal conserved region-domain-containing protein [Mycena filopes]|nr:Sedlin, N-terminal conserved region-domain-containing protein [Mycena filopes]
MSKKVLKAVAFISPENRPILIRTFSNDDEQVKYQYIAHTSLDEERVAAGGKATECYLGLLYAMEDVAVYGYITPLKVKIVIALALSDSVVRDVEINLLCKALHMAYYSALSNPFLKLDAPTDATNDHSPYLLVGRSNWKNFRRRLDEISRVVSNPSNVSSI